MRIIENFINWLTDMDWQWYPYLSLRPEKHEAMDSLFILRVTGYYTPVFGVFSLMLLFLFPRFYFLGINPPLLGFFASLVFFATGFFIVMRLVVATAWNSRANRYRKQKPVTSLQVG